MRKLVWLFPIVVLCASCTSNVFNLVETGKTRQLDRLLFDRPGQVDVRDVHGRTPLHVAAYLDYPEVVNVLLKRGADPMARDNHKITPVQVAVAEGNTRAARVFLDAGFDVNLPLSGRLTLLDFAKSRSNNDDVIKLLREHGAKTGAERHKELFDQAERDADEKD